MPPRSSINVPTARPLERATRARLANLSRKTRQLCTMAAAATLFTAHGLAADEVSLKVTEQLAIKGAPIPYSMVLRLDDVSPTRMSVGAYLDLRGFQAQAPALLSSVLQEDCKQKFAVAISDVSAKADTVSVRGQFQAKFFGCNTKDQKVHYRRFLLFGQNVNFQATARTVVTHPCMRASLVDLQLDPLGLLGGAADLFGLTELAERLIVEKAEEALSDHPVCPKLPPEIASLEPRYTSGGIREIGAGGLGASLSGSVNTSAATILDLVRVMKDRGILGPQNQ